MSPPESASLVADPPWPLEAWRVLSHELRDFVSLVWRSTRSPYGFYSDWARGRTAALNPILAIVNAVSLIGVWSLVWSHLSHVQDASSSPWLVELLNPLIKVGQYALFALVCHGALLALGARNPLRTTMGAVLYCSSGPLMLLTLALIPPLEPLARDRALLLRNIVPPGDAPLILLGKIAGYSTWILLGSALAGTLPRGKWRVPLAMMLVFGLSYGLGWLVQRFHPAWMT